MAKKNASAIDTMTLKPTEVAQAIRVMSQTDVSLFIWGPPGISKSAIMQQVAKEQGREFVDIRLSQMDPTDLRGIPYPVEDYEEIETDTPDATGKMVKQKLTRKFTKGMRWSPPLVLPRDPDSRAFIALEEFNSAPQTVQAAAYQLVLDRRLGEYELPKGCVIVAAGNRETDKGITFKMPTPIANRFVHLEMRVDFDDWQTWALKARIHKDVVGYLTAFKSDLFEFDPASASRGFPTPRSWEFVSKTLHKGQDMHDMVALGLLAGAVGDGVGVKFLEYRRHAADLPDTRLILSGEITKFARKPDVSLCYALTTALCYELAESAANVKRNGTKENERNTWLKHADNFLAFMMNNFVAEICIMGAKTAIAVHKLPFDVQRMKNFDKFANEFKDFIMA